MKGDGWQIPWYVTCPYNLPWLWLLRMTVRPSHFCQSFSFEAHTFFVFPPHPGANASFIPFSCFSFPRGLTTPRMPTPMPTTLASFSTASTHFLLLLAAKEKCRGESSSAYPSQKAILDLLSVSDAGDWPRSNVPHKPGSNSAVSLLSRHLSWQTS